jgi:hypothetical protein
VQHLHIKDNVMKHFGERYSIFQSKQHPLSKIFTIPLELQDKYWKITVFHTHLSLPKDITERTACLHPHPHTRLQDTCKVATRHSLLFIQRASVTAQPKFFMAFNIEDWVEGTFLSVDTQAVNQPYTGTAFLYPNSAPFPSGQWQTEQSSGLVNTQELYQPELYRTAPNPTLSVIPPPGQWQHIPCNTAPGGTVLAYRDLDTDNVICAPYAGYNPGPYTFDLSIFGLGVGLYTMCGPHYNKDGRLTYLQQFDLDAATGGRIWGGYQNYHGFEIFEHMQDRHRMEAAKTAAEAAVEAAAKAAAANSSGGGGGQGEALSIGGAHGLAERMLEYRRNSPYWHGGNNSSGLPAKGVRERGATRSLERPRKSPNRASSTTKTSTSSMDDVVEQDSTNAKQRSLELLLRFTKVRPSVFSSCPGPCTRLPQGLILTTIEVLT